MKPFLLPFIFFWAVSFSANGQANTKLSNLVAPTAINADLLPNSTNSRYLGSSTLAWKDLYLRGDVYLDGTRFLSNAPGTASLNTFVGSYSGQSMKRGNNNTAVGHYALYKDTSGSSNTAIGSLALYNNSNGFNNIAIGREAMRENKTGFYNIGIGNQSLMYNNGSGNIAIGLGALVYSTIGRYNIAVGANSLYVTRTAEYNTAIGSLSGNSYNNGYNNVFVGANTDVNGSDYYNVIVIGQGTIGTTSSQVTMGNSATSTYRAYASWSNISDGRFKKNVEANVPGLAFISLLRPVTYQLKAGALDKFLSNGQDNELGVEAKAVMEKAFKEKEALTYSGFVAQEVEKAAKELDYDFSGVETPTNEKDVYAIKYSDFVVPLVKAVQELEAFNNEKEERIAKLEKELSELKTLVMEIKKGYSGNINTSNLSSAYLVGNSPNPSRTATIISYHLPSEVMGAQLLLTDMKGALVKSISLAKGSRQVTVHTELLAAGTYTYSLWINNQQTDAKQLLVGR